ncbi:MAG TPA: Ig-like domain-containing protein, partial [Anaerolineales bacterium]
TYERFAPQNPNGQADSKGIREFVVGTGGAGLYSFTSNQPNSQVRNNTTHGVLKLTLHSTSYDWQFIPIAGQNFTDSGSANCVGSGSAPTPTSGAAPTRTPTSPPGATNTMHIGDLDGTSTKQGNKWTANVTITVHDTNHNPVANATVTGNWSNGATGTASCTTGSNGQCSVNKSGIRGGKSSVTFTVNNVTRSNYTYASASNHDPDGSSNGIKIVVRKP